MADSNYKRYSWLDILKGFGIIFVVLGHFCSIDSVYHWTYSFHMPLFFLASGYLYHKRSVMSTIKHKFLTLMVPYFLFGIITSIYYVLNEFIFAREVNFSELVLGLLYGTYSSIVYNKVLWFLPVLFCISVIYNMLKVGGGGQKSLYVLVAIITVLSILEVIPSILPWGMDYQVCHYMIYYMLGNILAEKGWIEGIRKLPVKYRCIWAFLLLCGHSLIFIYREQNELLGCVIALVGIAEWIFISILIENHGKILEYIGQASLGILCIHMPVDSILSKILVRMTDMTFESGSLELQYVLVRCVLTIIICLICNYIIMRFLPWMLGRKKTSS